MPLKEQILIDNRQWIALLLLTSAAQIISMVPVVRTLEKECFAYRHFFIPH